MEVKCVPGIEKIVGYAKDGVDVIIDEIVNYGIENVVGAGVFRCIDCEVNISMVYLMWMLMTV